MGPWDVFEWSSKQQIKGRETGERRGGGEGEWMADFDANTRKSQKMKCCASSSRATPNMTRSEICCSKNDKRACNECDLRMLVVTEEHVLGGHSHLYRGSPDIEI